MCHMGDIQGCDFNLRDILRWCELISNGGGDYKVINIMQCVITMLDYNCLLLV